MFNGFIGKLNRITTVVTNAVKKFGEFFIKLLEENFGRVGVWERNTQVTAVNVNPMFQGKCVGHFESVFGGMKHKPFMRMRPDGFYTVFHCEVNIWTSDEVTWSIVLNQRIYNQIVYFIRMSTARTEFGKSDLEQI